MKDVEILSENQWQVDWRQERRLALLFEPSIEEDPWCGPLIKEFWLPHWQNRLDFVTQAADFCAGEDKYRSRELDGIVIQRRSGTAELEGSAFNVCELNEARESGTQHYSSHIPPSSPISASPQLHLIISGTLAISCNRERGGGSRTLGVRLHGARHRHSASEARQASSEASQYDLHSPEDAAYLVRDRSCH